MGIPLTAGKRGLVYAGRRIKAGRDFEVRTKSEARILKAIGKAVDRPQQSYQTRVMTAAPPAAQAPARTDEDLDSMDIDALRALAAHLGVKVHPLAGAYKVRQAIRASRGE